MEEAGEEVKSQDIVRSLKPFLKDICKVLLFSSSGADIIGLVDASLRAPETEAVLGKIADNGDVSSLYVELTSEGGK
jgi:hypothetical protein